MIAPSVSISPSFSMMMKVGISVSWNGMISVASITASSSAEPRKRSRANA